MENEASPTPPPVPIEGSKTPSKASTVKSKSKGSDEVKKKPSKGSKGEALSDNQVDKKKSKVSKKTSEEAADAEIDEALEKYDKSQKSQAKSKSKVGKKKKPEKKDDKKKKKPWKYTGGTFALFKRYYLFIINILVLVVGIVMVIFGAKLYQAADKYAELTGSALTYLGIALAVLGGIIIFIACLGFCGAITKNRCALILYVMLLFAIFIVMIAVGVALIVFKQNPYGIKAKMVDKLISYHIVIVVRKAWNVLHVNLACCGVEHGKGKVEWEAAYPTFMANQGFANWRNLTGISSIPGIADVTEDEVLVIFENIKNNPKQNLTLPDFDFNKNINTTFPFNLTTTPTTLTSMPPKARNKPSKPTINSFTKPGPGFVTPPDFSKNDSKFDPSIIMDKHKRALFLLEQALRLSKLLRNNMYNWIFLVIPPTCCTNKKAHEPPYVVYPSSKDDLSKLKDKPKAANGTNATLPDSIEPVPIEICDKNKTADLYQTGCLDKIMEKGADVGKLAIGLSILLLAGMIGACLIILGK